jgi:hypothetical protein
MSDLVVDARNNQQIANLADWCRGNLSKNDWDYDVITMFPLRIKFRFHCPKTKLLAILST